MPEKINIASLTIDFDDVIKKSADYKKQIDGLKESQKGLDKTTEDGRKAFVKMDVEIKNLSKSYRDNQNFARALDKANKDLEKTMSVENKSTQELRDSRSQLNQISKQIKGSTEDEIKLRDELNKAIDEQTEALRGQGSEFNASKDKVGEYSQALEGVGIGAESTITGLKGVTKQALAFIATPLGLVLAAIAGAFALIKNAMDRSEDSASKVKKAFAAFSGIAKGVLKALQPLGEFLIDGLVKGLELVEKGVKKTMDGIVTALEFLGFDEAAASVKNFNEEIEKSAEANKELVQAELELAKAQRIARKTQLEFQKEAEIYRQIRDDENKSIAERTKANEDLGKVLKKQLGTELAIAQKALDVANLRIKLEGETTEALDSQADALTEIADIEERITGQASEQLTNRVALQKEGAAIAKEIADKKIEQLKKDAEAAVEIAEYELNQYIRTNQSKLDSDKFFTDEALKEEQRRLEGVAQKRREFEKKRFDEGLIGQAEYNEAINQINFENQEAQDEAEQQRKDAKEVQEAIDYENKLAIQFERNASEYQILTEQLEADRLAEVADAEKTGADIDLINRKYAARQKQIDEINRDNRLSAAAETFGGVAELLGEHTAAGKAAGIAQATINTYQGVTEVWKAPSILPEPFNTASKIVATGTTLASGLSAVKKITSTKTKFADGGILSGASHSDGGIKTPYGELEGGEAVINKRSTSMFAPLLSSINQAGGGKKFANGGILGASNIPSPSIDYDILADKLAEANAALPAPKVSVEEINSVSDGVQVIENDASFN